MINKRHEKKAFTLVESVVVHAILAETLLIVMTIFVESFRTWLTNQNYVMMRADARSALSKMVLEMRQAETFTPTSGTSNNINFNSDIDNNGTPQLIRYDLVSNELIRGDEGDWTYDTGASNNYRAWIPSGNVTNTLYNLYSGWCKIYLVDLHMY